MPNTPAQDLAIARALDEAVHRNQLGIGNTGSAVGRVLTQVMIDMQTLAAAASFASAAFAAEQYQSITMEIDGLETSATFSPVLNLTGAGPTAGAASTTHQTSAAQVVTDNTSSMVAAILTSAGGNIAVHGQIVIYPLTTGNVRHYRSEWHSSGVIRKSLTWGQCTDTTNGITAVGWTGSTSFTGTVRVFGVPA